ncbi:MAG: hypothetical protein M5R36_27835 [Deltaproteobacteria bacterium]|nr:hypothetical protein [Deltaproteobacteria bacterium]
MPPRRARMSPREFREKAALGSPRGLLGVERRAEVFARRREFLNLQRRVAAGAADLFFQFRDPGVAPRHLARGEFHGDHVRVHHEKAGADRHHARFGQKIAAVRAPALRSGPPRFARGAIVGQLFHRRDALGEAVDRRPRRLRAVVQRPAGQRQVGVVGEQHVAERVDQQQRVAERIPHGTHPVEFRPRRPGRHRSFGGSLGSFSEGKRARIPLGARDLFAATHQHIDPLFGDRREMTQYVVFRRVGVAALRCRRDLSRVPQGV